MAALPPVLPSDIQALIPGRNASFCEKFIALPARLAIKLYAFWSWMMDEDGVATDELKTWLGVGVSSSIPAPTALSATDGTLADKVTLTWTASVGAQSYTIYRSEGTDSASATAIGSVTVTTFDDTTVTAGTVYNYWLKAVTASGTSDFSGSDSGYSETSSGGGGSFVTQVSSIVFTATYTGTHTIKAWGGGGGGKGGTLNPYHPSLPYFTGGKGGGSSGYSEVTLALTAGDEIQINVGTGGAVNGDGLLTTATLVTGGNLVIRTEAGQTNGVAAAAWDDVTYPPDGSVTVVTNNAGVAGGAGGTAATSSDDATAGAGADAPSNGSATYGNGGDGGGYTGGVLTPSAQVGKTGAVVITW